MPAGLAGIVGLEVGDVYIVGDERWKEQAGAATACVSP